VFILKNIPIFISVILLLLMVNIALADENNYTGIDISNANTIIPDTGVILDDNMSIDNVNVVMDNNTSITISTESATRVAGMGNQQNNQTYGDNSSDPYVNMTIGIPKQYTNAIGMCDVSHEDENGNITTTRVQTELQNDTAYLKTNFSTVTIYPVWSLVSNPDMNTPGGAWSKTDDSYGYARYNTPGDAIHGEAMQLHLSGGNQNTPEYAQQTLYLANSGNTIQAGTYVTLDFWVSLSSLSNAYTECIVYDTATGTPVAERWITNTGLQHVQQTFQAGGTYSSLIVVVKITGNPGVSSGASGDVWYDLVHVTTSAVGGPGGSGISSSADSSVGGFSSWGEELNYRKNVYSKTFTQSSGSSSMDIRTYSDIPGMYLDEITIDAVSIGSGTNRFYCMLKDDTTTYVYFDTSGLSAGTHTFYEAIGYGSVNLISPNGNTYSTYNIPLSWNAPIGNSNIGYVWRILDSSASTIISSGYTTSTSVTATVPTAGLYKWTILPLDSTTGVVGTATPTLNSFVVAASPTSGFSGTPTSGSSPLSVAFTDSSANSPTSWSWNFGDGSTSTAQNPTHVYTTPGTYTVSLTSTNGVGSNIATATNYITVSAPVVTSPTNGGTVTNSQYTGGVSTNLVWNSITGATDYKVFIDGNGIDTGSTNTTYTTTLTPGSHSFYVQGYNTVWGTSSNTNTFTVAAYPHVPAPTIISPTNGTSYSPISGPYTTTFSWQAFTGYSNPLYRYTICNPTGGIITQSTTTSTSVTQTIPTGSNYSWYVQTEDRNYGGYGANSYYQTFTITKPSYNGSISGYVYNKAYNNNTLIPYATITVIGVSSMFSNITTADSNGAFNIPLAAMNGNGSYDIYASANGFTSDGSYPFTINSSLPGISIAIPLTPVATYYVPPTEVFSLYSANGVPLSNVSTKIYAGSSVGTSPIFDGYTDHVGNVVCPVTYGNTYTVTYYDPSQNVINVLPHTSNAAQGSSFITYVVGATPKDNQSMSPTFTPLASDLINCMSYSGNINISYGYINQTISSKDGANLVYTTNVYGLDDNNVINATKYTYNKVGSGTSTYNMYIVVPANTMYYIDTKITHPNIGKPSTHPNSVYVKGFSLNWDPFGFSDIWKYELLGLVMMFGIGSLFGAKSVHIGAFVTMLVGGLNVWSGWFPIDDEGYGAWIFVFLGVIVVFIYLITRGGKS
jgi:PKD repeat protein